MDEKRRRRDHDPDDAAMNRQVRRNLPPVVLLVVVSFIVFSLWRGTTGVFGPAEPAIGLRKAGGSGTQHVVKGTSKLVPLEAHMMSKCPDSRVRRGSSQELSRSCRCGWGIGDGKMGDWRSDEL